MKIDCNGTVRELTPEELAELETGSAPDTELTAILEVNV